MADPLILADARPSRFGRAAEGAIELTGRSAAIMRVQELIRRAALRTFSDRLGDDNDERLDRIVAWFDQGAALKIGGDERASVAVKAFALVPELLALVHDLEFAEVGDQPVEVAACELALEALAAQKRISRSEEIGWAAAKRRTRE